MPRLEKERESEIERASIEVYKSVCKCGHRRSCKIIVRD